MQEAIYLTDLADCTPTEALSDVATANQWQVVEYDAGEIKGRMLAAVAYAEPPEVHLPIDRTGWHGISIGFWPGIYHNSTIRYRLSNEEVCSVIYHKHEFQWAKSEIFESFPRYVDLTGADSIVLAKEWRVQAFIAYVKLDPLSQEQVEEIARDRQRTDTRRLFAINDGSGSWRTTQALRELVEPYRHSDFQGILWGANGSDTTFHPHSKVAPFYEVGDAPFSRPEGETCFDNHKALEATGYHGNPFEVVLEHCHDIGLEFHLYYRMALADHPYPIGCCSTQSWWLREHPECRIVAKDGTPMPVASYAFPQVREFMLSLIAEGMESDIDGVNLCLIRGPEYFRYEKPVIDDFMALYGEDPRDLPDDDERLLRLRAGYMTEFFRAVRKLADERGARRGRKIEVSTYVEFNEERMLYYGYDNYRWVEEKLVDFVIGDPPTKLLALAKQVGCKVYGAGAPIWGEGPVIETQVHTIREQSHAAGHDGYCFWDFGATYLGQEVWKIFSRLGHRDEVQDLRLLPSLMPKMKRTQLLTLAGRDICHTVSKNIPGDWPPEMLTMYAGG